MRKPGGELARKTLGANALNVEEYRSANGVSLSKAGALTVKPWSNCADLLTTMVNKVIRGKDKT